jgi:hypothetical protein
MSPGPAAMATAELDLPLVVTQLMKGVLYRDTHDKAWRHLLLLQVQVSDYVAVLGLTVIVDEAEGYAFLRSRPDAGEADPDHPAPPRLIARRSLSFPVSLLLALLRKKLAEFDASNSDTRLMLTRDQIVDMVRLFLPPTSNEARVVDQIDAHIGKAVELGFLRRVKNSPSLFEVRRILKAFVDGQWLADFDRQLARYAAVLAGGYPDADAAADDPDSEATADSGNPDGGDPDGGDPDGGDADGDDPDTGDPAGENRADAAVPADVPPDAGARRAAGR